MVLHSNQVVICKPDLDTCLTGLILHGYQHDVSLEIVLGKASGQQLHDANVLCIECGDSGNISCNNFDHHNPNKHLPPACRQAWDIAGRDPKMALLVEYVSIIDDARGFQGVAPFPALSHIFSGMLFTFTCQQQRYWAGLQILKIVYDLKLDPFGEMPVLPEWSAYLKRKILNMHRLATRQSPGRIYRSVSRRKIGFFESTVIGGFKQLYDQGCDIVVAKNPAFGEPGICKYTIASQNYPVADLLPYFQKMETGWGGRKYIIGSPYIDSTLNTAQILNVVKQHG